MALAWMFPLTPSYQSQRFGEGLIIPGPTVGVMENHNVNVEKTALVVEEIVN